MEAGSRETVAGSPWHVGRWRREQSRSERPHSSPTREALAARGPSQKLNRAVLQAEGAGSSQHGGAGRCRGPERAQGTSEQQV